MTELTPPAPPTNTNSNDNNKNIIIGLVVVIVILLVIAFSSSGGGDSNSSDTTTTVAATVPSTYAPKPIDNPYDDYLKWVNDNASLASDVTNSKLIEYGDTICNALDSGNSISWIVNYLSSDYNTQADNELYASIIYGSITYICPEYSNDLSNYLSN